MYARALLLSLAFAAFVLSSCEGWPVSPITYGTAAVPPSRTPFIRTATPFILSPDATPQSTETAPAATTSVTSTQVDPTSTATLTPTEPTSAPTPKVDVLGCDTGLDVLHGMGEVTNAYVTVSNYAATDLADVCITLNGLDEGRPHPDKTKCFPSIPAGYQVTLRLTVDTTWQEDTPIQIDIDTAGALLLRVGQASCTKIELLPPNIGELGVLRPIPLP